MCKTLSGQSLDDLETASTTTESSSFSADADEGEGKSATTAEYATNDSTSTKKAKKQKKPSNIRNTVAKNVFGVDVVETLNMAKVKPTVKSTEPPMKAELKSSSDKKQTKQSADVKPSVTSAIQKKVGSGNNNINSNNNNVGNSAAVTAKMPKSCESEPPLHPPLHRSNSCESPSVKSKSSSACSHNNDFVAALTPQKQKAKVCALKYILVYAHLM